MKSIFSYLPILLSVLYIGAAIVWLRLPSEYVALHVLAPREPELALPVYAQFVVTQTLTSDSNVPLVRLQVPIYFPQDHLPLHIKLLSTGKTIGSWTVSPDHEGIYNVVLPLNKPQAVEGKFEVQFDGSDISYDQRNRSPRIFVETSDNNYPYGNYRIAQNEKKGDVGLMLYAQKTNLQFIIDRWKENYLAVIESFLKLIFSLGIISLLPFLLFWEKKVF